MRFLPILISGGVVFQLAQFAPFLLSSFLSLAIAFVVYLLPVLVPNEQKRHKVALFSLFALAVSLGISGAIFLTSTKVEPDELHVRQSTIATPVNPYDFLIN